MSAFYRSRIRPHCPLPILALVSLLAGLALSGCLQNDVLSSATYHPVTARIIAPAAVDMKTANADVRLEIRDGDDDDQFRVLVTLNADTLLTLNTRSRLIRLTTDVQRWLIAEYDADMDSVVIGATVQDLLGHEDHTWAEMAILDSRPPGAQPPATPLVIHPADHTLVLEIAGHATTRVSLQKESSSHRSLVQFSTDPEFTRIALEYVDSDWTFDVSLETGEYYWRAAAFYVTSGDTLYSEWSPARHLIARASELLPDLSDVLTVESMVPDGAGGLYITGNGGTSGLVRHVDEGFGLIWTHDLPRTNDETTLPRGLTVTSDGDLLIVTYANSYSVRRRAWCSRWSPEGEIRWNVSVIPTNYDHSEPYSIAATSANGAWIGLSGAQLVSVAPDSSRSLVVPPPPTSLVRLVRDQNDGSFVYAGTYDQSAVVGRLDPFGARMWSRGIHAPGSFNVASLHLQVREDGSVLFAGSVDKGVLITSLSSSGSQQWERFISAKSWGANELRSTDLVASADGSFYVVGQIDWGLQYVEDAGFIARFGALGDQPWLRVVGASQHVTAWRACMRGADVLVSGFFTRASSTDPKYAEAPIYLQMDMDGMPVALTSSTGRRSR